MMNTTKNSEKSIGEIIRRNKNLTPEQIEAIVAEQVRSGAKFGEAAVELGLANRDDVMWALSQQFHYPYAHEESENISAELVVASNPFSAVAETFRDLRTQLLTGLFAPGLPRRCLAVLSPCPGDGKSFLAANLAVAFSQMGSRTLLLDADMRTPRQHEIFGIENGRNGLSGVLSGRSETNVIRPVDVLPNFYVMTVGTVPPNPMELVQRPAFGLLLGELLQKFEYVIVDTPAATHGSDAKVIAATCGAAIAVGRREGTKTADMKKLIDSLPKSQVQLAGVILNQC
jgi:protein-tyrosine kinase